MSAAQNLVKRIESGEAYDWANNQQNLGRLKEAIAKCDSNMRGFDHDFLVVESKSLQARVGKGQWIAHIHAFMDLKPFVNEIARLVKFIITTNKIAILDVD